MILELMNFIGNNQKTLSPFFEILLLSRKNLHQLTLTADYINYNGEWVLS